MLHYLSSLHFWVQLGIVLIVVKAWKARSHAKV